jgi:response regulator RpfG family c-di-GMP phosphodiesterase
MGKMEVAVLITDMRMPEMSGLELLKIVQEKFPDTIRIILTGYAQISTLISAINSGQVYRYLTKPWKLDEEFIPTINQAIDYYLILKERKRILKKLKSKNLELNKQNLEIHTLIKEKELIDKKKTEIIFHLSDEIIPYISKIIKTTSSIIDGTNTRPAAIIKEDLKLINDKGMEIFELLKKVEALVK